MSCWWTSTQFIRLIIKESVIIWGVRVTLQAVRFIFRHHTFTNFHINQSIRYWNIRHFSLSPGNSSSNPPSKAQQCSTAQHSTHYLGQPKVFVWLITWRPPVSSPGPRELELFCQHFISALSDLWKSKHQVDFRLLTSAPAWPSFLFHTHFLIKNWCCWC